LFLLGDCEGTCVQVGNTDMRLPAYSIVQQHAS
jgi:hypothetical protein